MNNKFLIFTASCMLLIFSSCSKEESVVKPKEESLTKPNDQNLIRKVKVFTSDNETFAIVTIKARSETIADNYEQHFRNLDLQIEYLDNPQNSENADEGKVSEQRSLEIPDDFPAKVHLDFSKVVDYAHNQSDKMFSVGFKLKNESKSALISPWTASGDPAMADIYPMADGFRIVNYGPNANWNVADEYGTIGFSTDLSGSSSVDVPVWVPLIDHVAIIMGVDLTWPYQDASGGGVVYYQ